MTMKAPTQIALRRLTQVMRPVALRSAGRTGSKTAVVGHIGRKSGRSYRTPVVAVERGKDGFLIALPYDDRTDWLKNVLASGEATVRLDGSEYRVDSPVIVPIAEATGYFDAKAQRLHRRFHVASALWVHRV
jgi:deazaflavin-dependent oxidoreductase (nitroreductase family)